MIQRAAFLTALLALGAFLAPAAVRADNALFHPDSLRAHAPAHYDVLFKTTAGAFTVRVTRAWAPLGADRFYNLVQHHYYDGTSFFRVVPGFVVQFGLSGNPALNAIWPNARIADDPVTQHNVPGTLTFADSGPNSRTTQLFINLGDDTRLDAMGFAPFGQVVSGMDAVKRIYAGYGETPDQGSITSQGDAYLRGNFPRIDRIVSARIQGR
jgi:peptidyl-prolyl cis-trans isomerase A (cyclophilin A)